MILVTLFLLAG